jgi:hypothetical protein
MLNAPYSPLAFAYAGQASDSFASTTPLGSPAPLACDRLRRTLSKCRCWIQMIRTILFLVAFDSVWTCRETKTFQRNTLSPSSMYFGPEHKYIIFLQIDGIDIQAHRTTILSSSLLRELPVSLYIIISFIEIKILFEVWKFMNMARHC